MKQRFSPKREEIRAALAGEPSALSAAALHATLPHLDLTTIYRNLERFVAAGDVRKISLGGDEALYEYQPHPHHHAICTDCQQVLHFTAPDDKIKQLLGLHDFTISTLEITVHGTCRHGASTTHKAAKPPLQ